jgi:hypothetical protein
MTIKNKLVLTPSVLATLDGPKAVRTWFGASLSEMGGLLREHDADGRSGRQFRRGTISMWENGRKGARWKMGEDIPALYVAVVNDTVRCQTRGRVAIRSKLGTRRWRLTPVASCATCGRGFTLEHSRQKNCGRCRARCKR